MKIDSPSMLYTATSIPEKTAAQIKEQPKGAKDLQDDSITLSNPATIENNNSKITNPETSNNELASKQ